MNKIRNAVVSESSITSYCSCNAAFLGYFIDLHYDATYNGPDLITQQWLDILAPFRPTPNRSKKEIKKMLRDPDPNVPPIKFDDFKSGEFTCIVLLLLLFIFQLILFLLVYCQVRSSCISCPVATRTVIVCQTHLTTPSAQLCSTCSDPTRRNKVKT